MNYEKYQCFSHLTLEERRIILTGIINGSTKSAIAKTIGKDKSTIGKEIRLHRSLTHKCKLPLECNNYRKCTFACNCSADCTQYSPFRCSRRDRSPGAYNECSDWSRCRFSFFNANGITPSPPCILSHRTRFHISIPFSCLCAAGRQRTVFPQSASGPPHRLSPDFHREHTLSLSQC